MHVAVEGAVWDSEKLRKGTRHAEDDTQWFIWLILSATEKTDVVMTAGSTNVAGSFVMLVIAESSDVSNYSNSTALRRH
jgi:hypothetical protein